jgi:hypothetical protein
MLQYKLSEIETMGRYKVFHSEDRAAEAIAANRVLAA